LIYETADVISRDSWKQVFRAQIFRKNAPYFCDTNHIALVPDRAKEGAKRTAQLEPRES
jgi:hypothetical protein